MALSDSAILDQIETAITAVTTAMATGVEEYYIGSRRVRRADFARNLDTLMDTRERLKRRIARSSSSPVRVGKLGRSRTVDR